MTYTFKSMADNALKEIELHLDEVNRVRLLDPQVNNHAVQLNQISKEFIKCLSQFLKNSSHLISFADKVAEQVEKEKLKAIRYRVLRNSRNLSIHEKEQQLLTLIAEKKIQLNRLEKEYKSLLRIESEQQEFIENFILQK